jgi:hypothetical protein
MSLIYYIVFMARLSNNTNIPTAVSNLRLCSALRNCGRIGVQRAMVISIDEKLYVYDDATLGYSDWTNIVPPNISETFCADNPNKTEIVLLPLDNRIITGPKVKQGGVCDCALLTVNELCLIEFKTNAKTESNKTLEQRCREALSQILNTINGIIKPKCNQQRIDIERKVDIDAYIVFDNELNVTGIKATFQAIAMDVLEENKLLLYVDNKKTFL